MMERKRRQPSITVYSCSLLLTVLVGLLTLTSVPALAQSGVTGFYGGHAYGTYAFTKAGPVSGSQGQTAYIAVPCLGTGGRVHSNTLAQLDVPTIISTGTLHTTVVTNVTASSKEVTTTSTVEDISLLNGLIKADAVAAVATRRATASSLTSTAADSRFVNLQIGLLNLGGNVAPNTRITLPGLGHVILYEVIQSGDGVNQGTITVNMLHVKITLPNHLGLPVGLEIIVGHAVSAFTRSTLPVALGGTAYAAWAAINSRELQGKIGALAPISIGCEGTGGQTKTNTVNSVDFSGVLSLDTGKTTAFGQRTNTSATGRTTATLTGVDLFNGLIQADVLTAVAESRFQSGQYQSNTTGSGFDNLRIQGVNNGQPLLNIAPNTKVTVPGIGTVTLYKQKLSNSTSQTGADVTMIHIIIGVGNTVGLPVGSEIRIAQAISQAKSF